MKPHKLKWITKKLQKKDTKNWNQILKKKINRKIEETKGKKNYKRKEKQINNIYKGRSEIKINPEIFKYN